MKNIALFFSLIAFLSFIFFKVYIKLKILEVKTKDEFLKFKRSKLQNGAGVVFVIIFFLILLISSSFQVIEINLPRNFSYFCLSSLLLSIICFLDDKYNLNPTFRFSVQLFVVYVALSSVPHMTDLFRVKINILIAVILWVYILNVVNFIDGADGLCSILSISFFLNTIIICSFYNLITFSMTISLIAISILIIFLIFFNLPPAKLFMGDTGSVFLGFLIGYVMIELSYYGYFLLILSALAYPLLDVSTTLVLRILNGRKPWERLSDFFFLIPKKKISYSKNFLSIEKKILLVGLLYLFFSFLTLQMSIYKQWHYIALLNFIFSFCLILLYKFRINR